MFVYCHYIVGFVCRICNWYIQKNIKKVMM